MECDCVHYTQVQAWGTLLEYFPSSAVFYYHYVANIVLFITLHLFDDFFYKFQIQIVRDF